MSHRGTKTPSALLNIEFPILFIGYMHAKFFNLVLTEYSVVSRRTKTNKLMKRKTYSH
jgi:hypothetical protein